MGMTAHAIEMLPTKIVPAQDDEIICSICFDVLAPGELAFQLSCVHQHHQDCLRVWLARKAECPECRTSVRCANRI
jgi:hypothetical protein